MTSPDEETMVEESLEVADKVCTAWEAEFLESLQERFETNPDYELSQKQTNTLADIYQKVCKSPY